MKYYFFGPQGQGMIKSSKSLSDITLLSYILQEIIL